MEIKESATLSSSKVNLKGKKKKLIIELIMQTLTGLKTDFKELKNTN